MTLTSRFTLTSTMAMVRRTNRVLGTLLIALPAFSCGNRAAWSPGDTQAVETTLTDYRRAWLTNDTARIMAAISDDITLFVPGMTASNVMGKADLRSFWFPRSDTLFVIKTYEITDQEIHGSGDHAIAQGKSVLSWDTVSRDSVLSSTTAKSEYLSVLRKEAGKWRIFRQMYVLRR